jgi:hypothetical protein
MRAVLAIRRLQQYLATILHVSRPYLINISPPTSQLKQPRAICWPGAVCWPGAACSPAQHGGQVGCARGTAAPQSVLGGLGHHPGDREGNLYQ